MGSKKRCAYLTMGDPRDFFIYDHLTYPALEQLGWSVKEIPWNQPNVDWAEFDVVAIRSPWDYQNQVQEFLNVLEKIDQSSAILQNPLDIVEWNIEKTYLKDMESRGVKIVPTTWLDRLTEADIANFHCEFETPMVVVKPLIGANADFVFRFPPNQPSEELSQAMEVYKDRPVMLQPFIPSVVELGEYSLFYFGGTFSHCILKTPRGGDFRVQEEHGGSLQPYQASDDLLQIGKKAIEAIGQDLLYARVDLVRLPNGEPVLIELELIEPSLYFNLDSESPRRFAEALDQAFE